MRLDLYIVIVIVRYSHPDFEDAATRMWDVAIVSRSPERAVEGAMNWAQKQKPSSLNYIEGITNFAVSGTVVFKTKVDCIGESVKALQEAAVNSTDTGKTPDTPPSTSGAKLEP